MSVLKFMDGMAAPADEKNVQHKWQSNEQYCAKQNITNMNYMFCKL